MKGKLTEQNYLDLWKYFDQKASEIKGAMFTTTTWIIGFAAALLGFLFAKLMDHNPVVALIPISLLMKLVSYSGMVLCIYAFFAIHESAKHIKSNWRYADNCKGMMDTKFFNFIIPKKSKNNALQIWDRLYIIVGIFLTSFFIIFLWSIFWSDC